MPKKTAEAVLFAHSESLFWAYETLDTGKSDRDPLPQVREKIGDAKFARLVFDARGRFDTWQKVKRHEDLEPDELEHALELMRKPLAWGELTFLHAQSRSLVLAREYEASKAALRAEYEAKKAAKVSARHAARPVRDPGAPGEPQLGAFQEFLRQGGLRVPRLDTRGRSPGRGVVPLGGRRPAQVVGSKATPPPPSGRILSPQGIENPRPLSAEHRRLLLAASKRGGMVSPQRGGSPLSATEGSVVVSSSESESPAASAATSPKRSEGTSGLPTAPPSTFTEVQRAAALAWVAQQAALASAQDEAAALLQEQGQNAGQPSAGGSGAMAVLQRMNKVRLALNQIPRQDWVGGEKVELLEAVACSAGATLTLPVDLGDLEAMPSATQAIGLFG